MGRKMKVVDSNKKHLTKAEKEMRKEVEELASDGLSMLPTKPPNHFNNIAKDEYKRVIKGMRSLPVRNLDWAVEMSKKNIVLVSSYEISGDRFKCVYEFEKARSTMQSGCVGKRTEKLFMVV